MPEKLLPQRDMHCGMSFLHEAAHSMATSPNPAANADGSTTRSNAALSRFYNYGLTSLGKRLVIRRYVMLVHWILLTLLCKPY